MHERGMLHDIVHPDMGKIVLPTSPLRFAGSPEPELRPEPAIGEHNAEVMSDWLSYDAGRIAELTEAGVLC
jgi:crotonobetainyl-CoA:carnitine CoA-transferase CaiB-like acyl-CoA transferase